MKLIGRAPIPYSGRLAETTMLVAIALLGWLVGLGCGLGWRAAGSLAGGADIAPVVRWPLAMSPSQQRMLSVYDGRNLRWTFLLSSDAGELALRCRLRVALLDGEGAVIASVAGGRAAVDSGREPAGDYIYTGTLSVPPAAYRAARRAGSLDPQWHCDRPQR